MIIGFDANEANVDRRVGSGQYAFEILHHLTQELGEDRCWIYLKQPPKRDLPQPNEQVGYRIFGPKPLWTQIALPLRLYLNKRPDVFFSPAHYAPRTCPMPSVITIHDLSYLKFPEYFLKKDLEQLKAWTGYSVKNAKAIITPSQSAKRDVVELYGVEADRITVIPHGYDAMRFTQDLPAVKINQIKQQYGIDGNYLLYLGTLQPRKNIVSLLKAFAQMSKQVNHKLVVVGKKGWLFEGIFAKVKALGIEQAVVFTDYVPDDEVPFLYAGADCYVLPSLYEGFGMPLLEAMACGTIVAASNVSSIPEVIGPGFLFDPTDSQAISKTLLRIINLSPTEKAQLQQKGIAFAKTFSWETSAKQTLTTLHDASKR